MDTTTTPVIENLVVKEQSVTLYIEMNLAGIPVTVTGQYNIHSNCFYPRLIMPVIDVKKGILVLLPTGESHDLEEACEALGWDYSETHDAIQEAVENRDS